MKKFMSWMISILFILPIGTTNYSFWVESDGKQCWEAMYDSLDNPDAWVYLSGCGIESDFYDSGEDMYLYMPTFRSEWNTVFTKHTGKKFIWPAF
jgi:hypothetical protein